MVCIYLATKITEEPRKQRDIINVGYKIANPSQAFLAVGDTLNALRETMDKAELVVLRVLGFNVDVDLPHRWIVQIVYGMAWWADKGIPPDDTERIGVQVKNVARTAWRMASDAVRAGLLDDSGSSRRLGAACVVLAMEINGVPLPARDLSEWADMWAKTSSRRLSETCGVLEQKIRLCI
ncbi:Cyclin- protein fam58a [Linderina pennispora]|nr:Cyclin- protein fam58a [Linderina pennispora]